MKIGITGITGFVGGRLAELAICAGHEVTGFSRSPAPDRHIIPPDRPPDVSGLDVVIHLAGEPILGLWTAAKKERIRSSRVTGTRRIVEAIRAVDAASARPRVLVSASAIGYYGDTGESTADESSPPGTGFLADVAAEWEAEALAANTLGVRVVCLRIGFVIGRGGALKLMLPAFRLGLGGPLGHGRQWMSVIHVDDVAGMALFAAQNESVAGPLNAVLTEPVRNAVFTKALAATVHRPAIFPAPAWMLRPALGGLSDVLLGSLRVLPRRAAGAGYEWRFPTLDAALLDAARP